MESPPTFTVTLRGAENIVAYIWYCISYIKLAFFVFELPVTLRGQRTCILQCLFGTESYSKACVFMSLNSLLVVTVRVEENQLRPIFDTAT